MSNIKVLCVEYIFTDTICDKHGKKEQKKKEKKSNSFSLIMLKYQISWVQYT